MSRSPEPHNFFMKQDISLQDAIDNSKPIPPWKQKLMNDLKGNIRTTEMKVIDNKPDETLPVKRLVSKNPRRWYNPIYVLLLLIEWALTMIGRCIEVIRKSFETLTLALESYINEPTRISSSD